MSLLATALPKAMFVVLIGAKNGGRSPMLSFLRLLTLIGSFVPLYTGVGSFISSRTNPDSVVSGSAEAAADMLF